MGIGAQVGEFAGGLIGEVGSMENNARIQRLLQEMRDRWDTLTPTEKVAVQNIAASQLGNVSEDPRYKNAENAALDRLMNIATSGGMTAEDKAKLEQAKLAGLDYERGVRGRNEDLMKRRGQSSSGAMLASNLAAEQGGINRAYQGDVAASAAASERALQALEAGGNFAEKLGSRDLSQKDLAAQANDAISRFNATRGDTAQYFNAKSAHQDALDKARGMDDAAAMEAEQNRKWADATQRKWRGYGKQAGALGDSIDAYSGAGG